MTPQQLKAMKMALEALKWCHGGEPCGTSEAITAIEEALAEHAMREVQRLGQEIEQKIGCVNHDCDQCKAQPEQEPVAWMNDSTPAGIFARHKKGAENFGCTIPLYTHQQPKREWVGLTDEEMHECAGEYPWTPTGLKCVRTIEAKLKQKNGYAEENT
jgi:hypothetical protein